jgi:hypothetical protein
MLLDFGVQLVFFLPKRIHISNSNEPLTSISIIALAVVLWYHTRLISERSPVRFPAWRTKNFSLHTAAVTSPTAWCQMTFGRHLSSINPRDSQPAHVEEEDKTAQPLQSTGEERTRGDQVVLSGRDNNSTMQSEHTVQKTLNIGIMPSGHHGCKKVARQIKTGYCLEK